MNSAGVLGFFAIYLMTGSVLGLVNHKNEIAINGYDVVAYFQNYKSEDKKNEGTKGSSKFSVQHRGVTYLFSSQKNKTAFEAHPEDFIPQYGGWCAWAMAEGESGVPIDPDSFLIAPDTNGKDRLYLFYHSWLNNTLEKWLAGNHKKLVVVADETWKKEVEKVIVDEKAKVSKAVIYFVNEDWN